MELLQTQLSDSKEEVERLNSQLLKLQEYNIMTQLWVSYISYYFSTNGKLIASFANKNW